MLKKTIAIFLCLIFALTVLCTDIVYAEQIKITEEELVEAFKKILENQDEDITSKISISNNVITITIDGKAVEMAYDFTNEPTFTVTTEIKSGMTYKQYQDEFEKSMLPLSGYMALLLNEYDKKYGEDSNSFMALYIMGILLSASQQIDSHSSYKIVDDLNGDTVIQDNSKTKEIKTSEFPDKVMEYVNDTFGNKFTISDTEENSVHSYDFTFEQTNVTSESCNIVSTLVMDTEGFYSILDKLNEESNKEENKNEENADYKVTLKVGQKCNIESNYKSSGYGVTSASGEIKFSEDYKEFTAIKKGNVGVTLYFQDSNNNEIAKSVYVTIEENTNNEILSPITLKIEGGSPQENNDKDNNSDSNNSNNNNNNNNTSNNKKDDGTTSTPIPKTGLNNIILTLFIVFIICSIIGLIKLNKYKDIK